MTTTRYNKAEQYRKIMAGAGNGNLESLTESANFSDDGVKDRTETFKEELNRIVTDYLGGKKDLHQLVDKIAVDGNEALKAVFNDDNRFLDRNPMKTNLLEVIVRTDGSRPSFMVRNGEVDKATSPVGTWEPLLNSMASQINDAIACVGRVNIGAIHIGTGFLVHKNLIITNRHVLQAIATFENNGKWVLDPGALIDFGYEFRARQSVNPRKMKRVVYCGNRYIDPSGIDHTRLDLALIELEPAAIEPSRILKFYLAPDWAQDDTNIFTIGYPGNPGIEGLKTYNTLLEQLFRSTFGCKRLAPGVVIESANQVSAWTVTHDATTLGGNSGSLIVIAGKEVVAGLHYGGTIAAPRENWGHILGQTTGQADTSNKTLKDYLDEFQVSTEDVI